MTFLEYVDRWKKNARFNLGEGWKLCQDQVIRDHIVPHIGHLMLRDVSPDHVSLILNSSDNSGHSKTQQRKIYNILSKMFNDAIHFFELINKSPIKKRFHRPAVHAIERPSLDPAQCHVVLEYVMHHPLYGSAIWIQMLAGLRVSEIQGLEWGDIDWKNDTINVNRAYNKHTKKIQNYTKNKNHYRVPLSPKLKAYLQRHRNDSRLVCVNSTGGMLATRSYDQYLKRIQAGLKLPIGSSHGLRHSCARLYASLGASDEDLQKLLGHKNLSSTKTYIHRTDESVFAIAKKIA